jgi:hypothetical protein
MSLIPQEDVQRAREMDLLTFLQNYSPQELVRLSPNTYCTREHDSLKISNGMWHWFSRGIGGRSALDYLIRVQNQSFGQAVETILGRAAFVPPVSHIQPAKRETPLLLPKPNGDNRAVTQYLRGRGIHPTIIQYCIDHKLLYESADYHNAVFLGYDLEGKARYANLRGTRSQYKSEATGSNKHYSFSIAASSSEVHLFEAAIDLLSYATLELMNGHDWRKDHLLSLAGVYKTVRKDVVPVALERYLSDCPQIRTLHLHLDNDEIGRAAAIGIASGLAGKYEVLDEPPQAGKDVNDLLMLRIQKSQTKEDFVR